ncbi:transmembrane protein 56-B-like isoform X1 [Arapaima gigas]
MNLTAAQYLRYTHCLLFNEEEEGLVAMDAFGQLIVTISLASFLFFQWVFHSVSPSVSSCMTSGFMQLSCKQKIEWNSRTVSTLHALLVGHFCFYILFFDSAITEDPVWGNPTLVKITVSITAGYLISDLLLIIYYWTAIGDKFFIVHHVAVLYACYYVLSQGMLPYFANFRLLAEYSTPCVNQRWFFEVLGYPKSSKANITNGIMMAIVFFLVRVAVIPVYYSRMYSVCGSEAFYRLSWGGRCAWILSSFLLDIMNVMWMVKIVRGCRKVLLSGRQKKSERQVNGKVD